MRKVVNDFIIFPLLLITLIWFFEVSSLYFSGTFLSYFIPKDNTTYEEIKIVFNSYIIASLIDIIVNFNFTKKYFMDRLLLLFFFLVAVLLINDVIKDISYYYIAAIYLTIIEGIQLLIRKINIIKSVKHTSIL